MFLIVYAGKGGFTYSDVMGMTTSERLWYLERINKLLSGELQEFEKAEREAKAKARRKR